MTTHFFSLEFFFFPRYTCLFIALKVEEERHTVDDLINRIAKSIGRNRIRTIFSLSRLMFTQLLYAHSKELDSRDP